MQGEGDGSFEAGILRKTHESALYDKVKTMYQQQNSKELMEIYGTVPKLTEEFETTQAKLEKEIKQHTMLNNKRKELLEKVLKLQKHINAGYRRAAEVNFARTYDNLRPVNGSSTDADEEESDEFNVRGRRPMKSGNRPELSKMSYSQRVMDMKKGSMRRSPSPAGIAERRRKLAAETSDAATAKSVRAASSSPERRGPKKTTSRPDRTGTSTSTASSTSTTTTTISHQSKATTSNGSGVQRRPLSTGSPAVSRKAGTTTTTNSTSKEEEISSPRTPRRTVSRKAGTTTTTTTTASKEKFHEERHAQPSLVVPSLLGPPPEDPCCQPPRHRYPLRHHRLRLPERTTTIRIPSLHPRQLAKRCRVIW
jgi:hypothetical protein